MGTTAEKLTYLNTTKQNLKTVINTTGAGLTDESTFRSYANVLNNKILDAINGDVDLFEEYPKVSGNGTDLSLNGVVDGKMAITPQGVSSQNGEPTPTTPIPVKSVTGDNILVISNSDNSESQTYPVSLGNIELCSTPNGTSRDYIYGSPNEWYKREYIGKVVLDGVNNVFTAKSNTNSNQLYISDEISNMVVPSSNNNLGKGLSSHFKIKTAQNIYANDLIGFGIRTDNKISFGFGISSNLTTLALANQWLQEQYNNGTPVTTYYLHVNYVDIPITDTTLINQLNNIYNNAHSYNGTTNITSTYENGNEQMYLDIEALKNVWEVTQ